MNKIRRQLAKTKLVKRGQAEEVQVHDNDRLYESEVRDPGAEDWRREEVVRENVEENMKEYLRYQRNKEEQYRLSAGQDREDGLVERRMFAIEVALEENSYVRFKDAEQYTRAKMNEEIKNVEDFLDAYNGIQ